MKTVGRDTSGVKGAPDCHSVECLPVARSLRNYLSCLVVFKTTHPDADRVQWPSAALPDGPFG
ncbi:MAG: hypothetical protein AAFY53_01650, partial [Pseudomonadota bacterium]